MHLNKVLYSFSYMCFTAGVAGILFAAIYLMVGNQLRNAIFTLLTVHHCLAWIFIFG